MRSFLKCGLMCGSGCFSTSKRSRGLLVLCVLLSTAACQRYTASSPSPVRDPPPHLLKPIAPNAPPQLRRLIDGAVGQLGVTRGYDPSYVQLTYPGGDVPKETGVCSDVVVRAFRNAGVDLQKEVHDDMTRSFSDYPRRWGLSRPDSNIDHRRVPNLMIYFQRSGKSLPISANSNDYQPGDVVIWDLGGGVDHIGIVTDMWSESETRCFIVHNIGAGVQIEDVLFRWRITGHYRVF